jgi:hypothetical protein
MGASKAIGASMILYGIACIVFSFAGLVLTFIPNLGSVGSWLFNPLGMAFSEYITTQLTAGNPVLWLGSSGVSWAVGGALEFLWVFLMLFVGVKLARR